MENKFTAGTGGAMLPRWIVESKTIYHTSSRQAKLKRPDWDRQPQRLSSPRIRAAIQHAHMSLKPATNGVLNLNEYRFWRAFEGKGRCRACLQVIDGVKTRMEHQREKGCTRLLIEAYKLLIRDRMCVVCDKKTERTKWGIPICSQACVYRWQFEIGAGAYNVGLAVRLHQSLTGATEVINEVGF